ncbi:MAG: hypothetical protein SGILL_004399, partial [Bacillariaceae sp.]
ISHSQMNLANTGPQTMTSSSETLDDRNGDSSKSLQMMSSSSSSNMRVPSARLAPDVTLLRPAREVEQKAKLASTLGSFRSAKLDLESASLVGRSSEVALLRERLFAVDESSNKPTNELVLLKGKSGSGKSRLAASLEKPVQKESGVFAQGKFEPNDPTPYAAIIQACNSVCKQVSTKLKAKENDGSCDMKKELMMKVDAPLLYLMMGMMPELYLLVHNGNKKAVKNQREEHPSIQASASGSSTTSGPPNGARRRMTIADRINVSKYQGKRRSVASQSDKSGSMSSMAQPSQTPLPKELLKVSFTTLIHILSSKLEGPIVLLIDDLQWADMQSLDLMKHLLIHPAYEHKLVLAATYRSDEIENEPTHPFHSMLRGTKEASTMVDSKSIFTITEITVENLSIEAIAEFLSEVLSISDASDTARVVELAGTIHLRTAGNVYFVKIFIGSLRQRGLLEFNHNSFSWKWDVATIERETTLTENVISLLQSKMQLDLQDEANSILFVLQIGSCLGNSFDRMDLELVVKHLRDKSFPWICDSREKKFPNTGEVSSILEAAVEEHFLVHPVDTFTYRFLHDKVREAAISLIPEKEVREFKASIGQLLYEHLPTEVVEEMLFVVVELLNEGAEAEIGNDLALEIVELNAVAAEKARQLSSFGSAGIFADTGLSLLKRLCGNNDVWEVHPHLALRLYTVAVDSAESTGDAEKSICYCDVVLRQKVLSPLDTIRVQCVVVERLHSQGVGIESIVVSLDLLEKLGCFVPRNKLVRRLKVNLSVRETLKKYIPTEAEIDKMDLVRDGRQQEVHGLIIRTSGFAYGRNEIDLYILLTCQAIQWTMLNGVTAYSPSALCQLANILMHLHGEWKPATALAKLALSMQERVNSNYTKCTTLQKSSTYILGWTTPLRQFSPTYLEAYRLGMLSGNIEGGVIAIWAMLYAQFCSGCPLSQLKDDLAKYMNQMERLHLLSYKYSMVIMYETVRRLAGETNTLPKYDERYFMFKVMWQIQVCMSRTYSGEYLDGASLALEIGDLFTSTYPGFYFGFAPFPNGVCLYVAARQTGQKRYYRAAKKVRAMYQKWTKSGGSNLVHLLQILDAEDAAFHGKKQKAAEMFEKAILSAVRGGFVQNAGLANERYAVLLKEMGREEDSKFYKDKAIGYFREWGAWRRVEQLSKGH